MPKSAAASRVNDVFFQPLVGLATTSPHTYPCPEYSEADWLRLGVERILERIKSGRAFLWQPVGLSQFRTSKTLSAKIKTRPI